MRISACVIVYNFHNQVDKLINNINSYLDYVEKLYIIDNSNIDSNEVFKFSDKIEYLPNFKNLGIAKALNIACEKALKDGSKFILTMDQDSSFSPNCIKNYLFNFERCIDEKQIAVYSLNYIDISNCDDTKISNYSYTLAAITSGSILNLEIYCKIGGFNSDLFIDEVDGEYCLRANKNGFKVVIFNNIYLNHNLGNTEPLIFNINHKTHPPLRMYYIFRNNLYVWSRYFNQYPSYVFKGMKVLFTKFIVIMLFENNKKQKLYFITRGFIDFFKNIYGEFKD